MNEQTMAVTNQILKMNCGSHLYGTNTPASDTDMFGIFVASEDYYLGLKKVEEVDFSKISKLNNGKNAADAVDIKYYELRKFIKLAMDNNPSILELLFVNEDNILFKNEIGKKLLENRHLFPHKGLYYRFTGYAHSQKHKMVIKGDKFKELHTALVYLNEVEDNNIIYTLKEKNLAFLRFEEKFCNVGDMKIPIGATIFKGRQMVQDRLNTFGNRKELVSKYAYDTKFAHHVIRLLLEGEEFLNTGSIQFPLKDRELLLDIKNGKYSLKQVLEMSDEIESRTIKAYELSELPYTYNFEEINRLFKSIIRNYV